MLKRRRSNTPTRGRRAPGSGGRRQSRWRVGGRVVGSRRAGSDSGRRADRERDYLSAYAAAAAAAARQGRGAVLEEEEEEAHQILSL